MEHGKRISRPDGGTDIPEVRVELRSRPPASVEVGRGTAIRLEGTCAAPGARIVELEARIGDNTAAAPLGHGEPGPLAGARRWDALVPIAPVAEPQLGRIELRVRLRGGAVIARELGSVRLEPGVATGGEAAGASAGTDLVAICIAAYDPPLDVLREQIEAIRGQTHRNWICIVRDDFSPIATWEELTRLLGDDDRFRLERAQQREGPYVSLERALRAVPPEAAYVALSGPKDRWREDGVAALIAALGSGDPAAYGDARAGGPEAEGPRSQPPAGRARRGLAAAILSGAASPSSFLIRRSVLDWALPFPPPLGAARPERWIALVAGALGGAAFAAGALDDRVGRSAAFGSRGVPAGRAPAGGRLRSLRRQLAELRLRRFRPNWRPAHDEILVRLAQEAMVLRLRLADRMTPGDRRTIELIARLPTSLRAQAGVLAIQGARAPRGPDGLGADLLRGVAWRQLVRAEAEVDHARTALRRPLGAGLRRTRATTLAALRRLAEGGMPLPGTLRGLIHVPASPREEAGLRAALAAEEPRSPADGPSVSLVIASRAGGERLERLLGALERARYRPLEVVVAHGGGGGDPAARLGDRRCPLPLRVVAPEEGRGLADAVNRGVRASEGELALLLDDGVEPVGPEWLGLMVETLRERDADCVGARLIQPRRPSAGAAGGRVVPDLTLQHRGIDFVGAPDGVPEPRDLGSGEDPRSKEGRAGREVPAVSVACMLVRRGALEEVGMLDGSYRGELAGVDLCLRLRERGMRIVYDGRAALLHRRPVTRGEAERSDRVHDRRRFVDRWGARLHRQVLRDRLGGDRRWSEAPLRIGITVTRDSPHSAYGDYHTARELGGELRRLGFAVTHLETHRGRWRRSIDSVDVVISLLDDFPIDQVPPGVISIAWARNWTERWIERAWFDDYDIVLASSRRACDLIERRTSQVAALMPLATNPDRFRPAARDPRLAADVVFAGNHWGVERQVDRVLPEVATETSVKVFGRGWGAVAGMDACHAGRIGYERLPAAYSSAGVVVDDSAHHTRPYGAVNSRVFDALACGALVASNDVEGVRDIFDGDFPVWEDAESLGAHAQAAREDPEGTRRLVERYRDQVLAEHTYAHRARQLRDALAAWCESTRFGIAVGVPSRELVESWGDYHYARALQRQLERRGHPTRVHLLPDWEREHPARDDVSLHLFGLSRRRPREGQLGVIWNVSHPELVTPELLDAYDLALVASPRFAAEVAVGTTTPVHVLRQATDPERFRPDPGPYRYELLFVGNSRKVSREVVDEAIRSGYELTIYGADWTPDLVDPRIVAGSSVPNTEVHRHYSAADIVLNDHWPEMRAHGFLSNRLYDALACASCVVSDHVEGIEEEFDDAVVTARGGEELRRAIDRLMRDPGERARRGQRGRKAVLERHTFDRRIEALLGWVEPLLAERPRVVVSGAPGEPRPEVTAHPRR